MSFWQQVVLALIGAISISGGPIAVVLIQKSRKEQEDFRIENDIQHGRSMESIKEILVTTRETGLDLRELRIDFEDHIDEHQDMLIED